MPWRASAGSPTYLPWPWWALLFYSPQQQALVGISMLTCLVMLLTCRPVSLLLLQLHKHIHFFPDIVNMLNMAVPCNVPTCTYLAHHELESVIIVIITRNVGRLRGKQND